jgi:HlyD family secretion protein
MLRGATIVLGLLALGGALARAADEAPAAVPPGMPPSPVVVATVEVRRVASPRTFVGAVAPSRETVVGCEFGGLVVEYLATEGTRFEADAPIARLRTATIDNRLEAARAEEELRAQELAERENGTRPEDLRRARALLEEVEAQRELRAWRLEAAQRLFDARTISEDELRDARLTLRGSERLTEALQAALDLAKAGPREEQLAQARARLRAQAAEVARLVDEQERHVIRAPFAGWITKEHAEVGQWIERGQPVAALAALDEVVVVVHVLEDHVGGIALGQEVEVSVASVPNLPPEMARGEVVAIVPRADPRARTFPVKIRVANRRSGSRVLLMAGMFARATFPVGEEVDALLVPKDALVLGGPQPTVYVVEPDDTIRPVPVTLGFGLEHLVQVTGPLEAGQRVVVRGNERLRPGQRVRVTGGE